MKLFFFLVLSVIYAVVAATISIIIVTQCGLGPDSPVACNKSADNQGLIFNLVGLAIYIGLSFFYWRRRDAGAR